MPTFRWLLPYEYWYCEPGPEAKTLQQPLFVGDFLRTAAEGHVYTDGSGGPGWVSPVIRQVGAGGAIYNHTGEGTDTKFLPAELFVQAVVGRQTVPRAEVAAATIGMQAVGPSGHLSVDASHDQEAYDTWAS